MTKVNTTQLLRDASSRSRDTANALAGDPSGYTSPADATIQGLQDTEAYLTAIGLVSAPIAINNPQKVGLPWLDYMDNLENISQGITGVSDVSNAITNVRNSAVFGNTFSPGNLTATATDTAINLVNPFLTAGRFANNLTADEENPFGQIPVLKQIDEGIFNVGEWINSTDAGATIQDGLQDFHANILNEFVLSNPVGRSLYQATGIPQEAIGAVGNTIRETGEFIDRTIFGGYLPGLAQDDVPDSQEWEDPFASIKRALSALPGSYRSDKQIQLDNYYEGFSPLQQAWIDQIEAKGAPRDQAIQELADLNLFYDPTGPQSYEGPEYLMSDFSGIEEKFTGRSYAENLDKVSRELGYDGETSTQYFNDEEIRAMTAVLANKAPLEAMLMEPQEWTKLVIDEYYPDIPVDKEEMFSVEPIELDMTGDFKTSPAQQIALSQFTSDEDLRTILGSNYLEPEVLDVFTKVEPSTIEGAKRFVSDPALQEKIDGKKDLGYTDKDLYYLAESSWDPTEQKYNMDLLDENFAFIESSTQNYVREWNDKKQEWVSVQVDEVKANKNTADFGRVKSSQSKYNNLTPGEYVDAIKSTPLNWSTNNGKPYALTADGKKGKDLDEYVPWTLSYPQYYGYPVPHETENTLTWDQLDEQIEASVPDITFDDARKQLLESNFIEDLMESYNEFSEQVNISVPDLSFTGLTLEKFATGDIQDWSNQISGMLNTYQIEQNLNNIDFNLPSYNYDNGLGQANMDRLLNISQTISLPGTNPFDNYIRDFQLNNASMNFDSSTYFQDQLDNFPTTIETGYNWKDLTTNRTGAIDSSAIGTGTTNSSVIGEVKQAEDANKLAEQQRQDQANKLAEQQRQEQILQNITAQQAQQAMDRMNQIQLQNFRPPTIQVNDYTSRYNQRNDTYSIPQSW